jgi:hypothetical protein
VYANGTAELMTVADDLRGGGTHLVGFLVLEQVETGQARAPVT